MMFSEANSGEIITGGVSEYSFRESTWRRVWEYGGYYSGVSGRHWHIRMVNVVFVDGHAEALGAQRWLSSGWPQ